MAMTHAQCKQYVNIRTIGIVKTLPTKSNNAETERKSAQIVEMMTSSTFQIILKHNLNKHYNTSQQVFNAGFAPELYTSSNTESNGHNSQFSRLNQLSIKN